MPQVTQVHQQLLSVVIMVIGLPRQDVQVRTTTTIIILMTVVMCPNLVIPKGYTNVTCDAFTYGSVCTLACADKYTGTPTNPKCGADGHWTHASGCSVPAPKKNNKTLMTILVLGGALGVIGIAAGVVFGMKASKGKKKGEGLLNSSDFVLPGDPQQPGNTAQIDGNTK